MVRSVCECMYSNYLGARVLNSLTDGRSCAIVMFNFVFLPDGQTRAGLKGMSNFGGGGGGGGGDALVTEGQTTEWGGKGGSAGAAPRIMTLGVPGALGGFGMKRPPAGHVTAVSELHHGLGAATIGGCEGGGGWGGTGGWGGPAVLIEGQVYAPPSLAKRRLSGASRSTEGVDCSSNGSTSTRPAATPMAAASMP